MNHYLSNIIDGSRQAKLEKTLFAFLILVLFKLLFPLVENSVLVIINDVLIYTTLALAFIFMNEITLSKSETPIPLVLNVGILSAVLFFITSLSSVIFDKIENIEEINGIIYTVVSLLISIIFIAFSIYILSALQAFYFLRQKRIGSDHFYRMLFTILLASFAGTLSKLNEDLTFVEEAFFVVSIVLISFNSFRVSWIAFLSKRKKIFLLFISIIMSGLFIANFAMFYETNVIEQIVLYFSPGVRVFYNLIMLYGAIYFGIVFFTTLFHLPTAGAFDQKREEITSLIDLSKLMTQVLDFKELADSLTEATNNVCNSDSAWIVINNDEGNELISVSNIGYLEAEGISQNLLKGLKLPLTEVITLNEKLIKVKFKNDERTFVFQSIIVAPLKVHSSVNGYLFAAKRQKYRFDRDEVKAIGAFADYAALAIENAKLIKESLEKERMENELEVARNIQSKLLPIKDPNSKELEVDSLFVPAFEVGGDYYDYFKIGEDKLAFVIADVSGKGVFASYIMAEVKGIFESLSQVILSPKELLIRTNDILGKSLDKKSFVTALYGVIDTKTGVLNFSRAGHMPLLICSNGELKEYLPNGIGLGLDFTDKFASNIDNLEIKLNNDDILILFTDGVTESQNNYNVDFGLERLKTIIKENCNGNLKNITKNIFQEVSTFSKDKQQHDDLTLVLFRWKN